MNLPQYRRREERYSSSPLLGVWVVLTLSTVLQANPQEEFFRTEVVPILRLHCYGCHSHESGQMESGLALDWKSGWENGGQRGSAIVPGAPADSLLIQAVSHEDPDLQMPEEKLSDAEIQTLIEWVKQGAYDDRVAASGSARDQDWWSQNPLIRPSIPTFNGDAATSWDRDSVLNPIDAFVESRLMEVGLSPSPAATPRQLIRRLYDDLWGLPPSAADVERWEADFSQSTYRAMVDRLLESPRYGERWARHWLDTIHFADSHGYEHDVGREHAWHFRDYVIDALNSDLPWSEFIRQQLAVDYFQPEASHLTPALGFLGAGTFDLSTYSTGPVTFDYLDRDDMLTQTMAAFVSTTANCARCHAHKFDPIPQEDYYALQAVFSGIVKGDVAFDLDPAVAVQRRRLSSLQAAANRAESEILLSPSNQRLIADWEAQYGTGADWKPVDMLSFVATDGSTLTQEAGAVIVASGPAPDVETYVVTAKSSVSRVTAIRLDLLADDSLPMKGPGRSPNGNMHLSEFLLTVFPPDSKSGQPIAFSRATADFNQDAWEIERAIDGDPKTAWGIFPCVGLPHHAVFELAQPLQLEAGSSLTVTLQQRHGGSHLIGAFQLAVTDSPTPQTDALSPSVQQTLRTPWKQRSEEQQLHLARHALKVIAERGLKALPPQATVYAAAAAVAIPAGNGKSQAASVSEPKTVHCLQRGDIDKPLAEAVPGGLSALTHLPARFTDRVPLSDPARRAALADWIAHPGNVLTWRSIVNRVWHYHFGRGLCDTPNDLGRMGGEPSHPELIDWLATWFRDDAGGSLKKLHHLIVTSRTYQQSSADRSEAIKRDSENRLLWRQNRRRLDADAYRDAVLSVSGCIDFTMGGPAVQNFLQSPGAQLTPKLDYSAYDWGSTGASRRSIYRFVWRGIPDPLMASLDFPDLGLLAPVRTSSTSPLQALSLFNSNFVLFHCQAMAEQIARQTSDVNQQVIEVVRRTYQRNPLPGEREQFLEFVEVHGVAAFCRLLLNSNEFLFIP